MNKPETEKKQCTTIHPTAIIETGAQLDSSVVVGAYAYIGPNVSIGQHTVVHHHGTVEGNTEMGSGNEVFPYAVIGGKTHDLKHQGGRPGLKVGDNNVFREYTTVHMATNDGDYTILGNDNVLLAYSHIAHDCRVGDHLIMSSHSALAGHAVVHDHVNIGWNVGVHQFCHLGRYCMIGACSKIVQSVLPYMLADGNPATVRTFNKVGLERAGFSPEQVELVRLIYQMLYRKGLNRSQALEALKEYDAPDPAIVKEVLDFVESSGRGLL